LRTFKFKLSIDQDDMSAVSSWVFESQSEASISLELDFGEDATNRNMPQRSDTPNSELVTPHQSPQFRVMRTTVTDTDLEDSFHSSHSSQPLHSLQPPPSPQFQPSIHYVSADSQPAEKQSSSSKSVYSFQQAVDYVQRVKTAYTTEPEVYKEFLVILQEWRDGKVAKSNVVQRLNTLFASNLWLVDELQDYLAVQRQNAVDEEVLVTSSHSSHSSVSTHKSQPSKRTSTRKLDVKDALRYLDRIKNICPESYNEFLDIMKEYKSQKLNTTATIARITDLFKEHPDLIEGFTTFLPPGYTLSKDTRADDTQEEGSKPKTPAGSSGSSGGKQKGRASDSRPRSKYGVPYETSDDDESSAMESSEMKQTSSDEGETETDEERPAVDQDSWNEFMNSVDDLVGEVKRVFVENPQIAVKLGALFNQLGQNMPVAINAVLDRLGSLNLNDPSQPRSGTTRRADSTLRREPSNRQTRQSSDSRTQRR